MLADKTLDILGLYGGFIFVGALFAIVLFVRFVGWCMGWSEPMNEEPVDLTAQDRATEREWLAAADTQKVEIQR